jgi:hypothetical protein
MVDRDGRATYSLALMMRHTEFFCATKNFKNKYEVMWPEQFDKHIKKQRENRIKAFKIQERKDEEPATPHYYYTPYTFTNPTQHHFPPAPGPFTYEP